ncbi:hypothetical protein ECANGB1_1717 [Enterospora canceri]|uniref:Uncharacterized protein n=1 Tax=Enterospora canceri TaxID=1081671 RepID=A0A1Y1S994_9MICR|nr:hypothetical protein ECANGB1_1717 [Enterospora canceri]
MVALKDIYLIIRYKETTVDKNTLFNKIKEKYGILGLADVFYFEIKEDYKELKYSILWIPRNCQDMIKTCIDEMDDCEVSSASGTIKKAKKKILKMSGA